MPVTQLTHHQSTATQRLFPSKQDKKHGVDHSLLRPLQRQITTPPPPLIIELLNAQSLNNKASFIDDHIIKEEIHFMYLVETWQQAEVYSSLGEACPSGCAYLGKARTTSCGGGGLFTPHLNALLFNANRHSPLQFSLFTAPPETKPSLHP